MAVGRKSVCSGEVVEVESDRPIRSSVIVTAYLSRKRAATPNWAPTSAGEKKAEEVTFDSFILFILYLRWITGLGISLLLLAYYAVGNLTSSRDYLLRFPTLHSLLR